MRLLRVVAAAAWVDGEVQPAEREFIERLLGRLPLSDRERAEALGLLDRAPHPAEADPSRIAPEHRELLMELVWQVMGADSTMSEQERDTARELEELLLGR